MHYGILNGPLGAQQSGYAADLQNQCKAAQDPPIEIRLKELAKASEELRTIVAGLQVSLQAVLTPQMKGESGSGTNSPKPIVAPLADRLDALNWDITSSIALLRDIHSRIAL